MSRTRSLTMSSSSAGFIKTTISQEWQRLYNVSPLNPKTKIMRGSRVIANISLRPNH